MHAQATLPYFAKPSLALSAAAKEAAYQTVQGQLRAVLDAESSRTVRMVTINCLLKTNLPYYFWVGFYEVVGDHLEVGPYQGTLGCLTIAFDRGVCGKAARTRRTQLVADTHVLAEGTEHIACDPNSQSEIVVPVFDASGELLAVFDVDSTLAGSFDAIDQRYLEAILAEWFGRD